MSVKFVVLKITILAISLFGMVHIKELINTSVVTGGALGIVSGDIEETWNNRGFFIENYSEKCTSSLLNTEEKSGIFGVRKYYNTAGIHTKSVKVFYLREHSSRR